MLKLRSHWCRECKSLHMSVELAFESCRSNPRANERIRMLFQSGSLSCLEIPRGSPKPSTNEIFRPPRNAQWAWLHPVDDEVDRSFTRRRSSNIKSSQDFVWLFAKEQFSQPHSLGSPFLNYCSYWATGALWHKLPATIWTSHHFGQAKGKSTKNENDSPASEYE